MFNRKNNKELKRWHLILLGVILICAIGYRWYLSFWPSAIIEVAGQEVKVLVANTRERQVEGWSKKDSMGKYGGMLFLFSDYGRHPMVMRQMRFPLDIVWLDRQAVVDIAPNLLPDLSATEDGLVRYYARASSTAVLELPAGFAAKYGLKVGDKVSIVD